MAKQQKYFNRELSWLSFNYRVLQEAKDPEVPLFEKIKFLAIYSSNLDEFFRVRVASLRNLLELKKKTQKKLDFDPAALLKQIHGIVHKQQEELGSIYREHIIPALNNENIFISDGQDLSAEQNEFISNFFTAEVLPLLQPMLLVPKKVKPFLQNKALYLAVRLLSRGKKDSLQKRHKYALVEIPSQLLPRFIVLPPKGSSKFIIMLDDIVRLHLTDIFPGYRIKDAYAIKLTRDAEMYIDDEFSGDLLEKIRKGIARRKTGVPSRFLYDQNMPGELLKILRVTLDLSRDDLVPGGRFHNFNDLFTLPNLGGKEL